MTVSMTDPSFPPLMTGQAVTGPIDPFEKACAMATLGCDGGMIVHNITVNRLMAAMVLAPEVPLEEAMAMLPACGIGFQNALGALAPPEVAVHLEWAGGIRVNGASCGRLRVAAGGNDPERAPGWLVVGLDIPLIEASERPGDHPERTVLYAEGCADLDPVALLESWARHTLVWITRWDSEGGLAALHAEWRGLAHGMGEDVRMGAISGKWLGVDERFGMLIRDGDTTHLIPLSSLLETAP